MREIPRRAAPRTRGTPSPGALARVLGSCLFLSLAALGACQRTSDPAATHVRAIDLLHEAGRASKRPNDSVFTVGEQTAGGETRPALAGRAPCRIIWTLRFPPRSLLRTLVAIVPPHDQGATIAFRVGVSDERLYDALAEYRVSAAAGQPPQWLPVNVDLSLYAGPKWSLFFRPDSHPWRLVFNADLIAGQAVAVWGSPGVDTDVSGARRWRTQAERIAQP